MLDHYHMVIETPKPNLSKGMRQLNGVYTQRFNQRHHRSGHLFQGRYKAIAVERSRFLLDVCRHVVLNPVRMGLARKPGSWKWSSYRATSGLEKQAPWLDTGWILEQFSKQRGRAQRAYEAFIQRGENAPLWENLRHQIYLGGDAFIKRLQTKPKLTTRKHRPGKQEMQKLLQLKQKAHNPKRAMAVAYLSGRFTLNEIARQFGVHYSTVSRAVKEYERRE
jgi:putative transposase